MKILPMHLNKIADWNLEPNLEALRAAQEKINKQPLEAISELETLSSRGSIISKWVLGDIYYRGEHIKKDYLRSKEWFEFFSAPERPFGYYMVGRILSEIGRFDLAKMWYRRGVEVKYLPCMYRLGIMCFESDGNCKIEGEALIREAAHRGHLFAKRYLAGLYLKGRFGLTRVPYGVFIFASLLGLMIRMSFTENFEEIEFDERILT